MVDHLEESRYLFMIHRAIARVSPIIYQPKSAPVKYKLISMKS